MQCPGEYRRHYNHERIGLIRQLDERTPHDGQTPVVSTRPPVSCFGVCRIFLIPPSPRNKRKRLEYTLRIHRADISQPLHDFASLEPQEGSVQFQGFQGDLIDKRRILLQAQAEFGDEGRWELRVRHPFLASAFVILRRIPKCSPPMLGH